MASLVAALALPWVVLPLAIFWRARRSRSLSEHHATLPAEAPLVSVIVPARNEAHNIARCVRSILASAYPRFELIVVDDLSDDNTRAAANAAAIGDGRLNVIGAKALPSGWFGKQWACACGASESRGEILCFTDADTTHGPELLTRSVNALRSLRADLLSVAGMQEMSSFWERVVQPFMFALLAARYGGTEAVNESRRMEDKIANGQFLMIRREPYLELGGHGAVRAKVAEDLALAQLFFAKGKRTTLIAGLDHLSTRMYRSLAEVVEGWMKNVYAGAMDAVPGAGGGDRGSVWRLFVPILLVLPMLVVLAPPLMLLLAAFVQMSDAVLLWAAICTGAELMWWAILYGWFLRISPAYALVFPLGAAVVLYIVVAAILRGRNVTWKDRRYWAE
ncbi:MAG: glycosyltransferase family 2 protein [Gemmatimonadaceae bacterium]